MESNRDAQDTLVTTPGVTTPARRRLAAAIGCVFATTLACAHADAPRRADWEAPLRADPANRVFATLPAVRGNGLPRSGSVHTVANCNDSGVGSLRSAIGGAGDGDVIDLSRLACSAITLQTGAIVVTADNLAIEGPGSAHLAIDGNGADRIFLHPRGGRLEIKGVTLRNGYNQTTGFSVAGGACIASAGHVSLASTHVRGCVARGVGAYGGAVYAYALAMSDATIEGSVADGTHADATTASFGGAAFVYALELQDSTISGNLATSHANPTRTSYDIGGGFVAVLGGTITGSTIDSNVSRGRGGGGAVFNSVEVSNSTISGNVAESSVGGGLFVRWPSVAMLHNATVTANRAARDGGGLWMNADGGDFSSSIVAGNGTGNQIGNQDNPNGALPRPFLIGGSRNLIGAVGAEVTIPADTLRAQPLLAPLARNGGRTRTHALLPGSPALDAGANIDGLAYDQRGYPYERVYGNGPDIGAFEQGALPPAPAQVPLSRLALLSLVALLALAALRAPSMRRRAARPHGG